MAVETAGGCQGMAVETAGGCQGMAVELALASGVWIPSFLIPRPRSPHRSGEVTGNRHRWMDHWYTFHCHSRLVE